MDGLLIAARAVHYAAAISLGGVFAFLVLVAGPRLSPRLSRRLSLLAWVSLGLVVGSGFVWLLAVSANMSGEPLADVLTQGALGTVLTATRFGQVWTWRFGAAVLVALLLLVPQARRGLRWRWSALLFAAALLASLAWAGHGASTPGPPGNLHLAADMLHLLAAGAWVGALVPLAMSLAEARRSGGAATGLPARRLVRRFSMLAAIGVLVLFAAGLINTWFLAGTVPALIGTAYGRLLLTKITIFVVMVVFGAVNLLRMTPRLAAGTGGLDRAAAAALAHLRRNAGLEAVLGLCVISIVAVLGTLPPGLHTEPGWPLPFRFDLAALPAVSKNLVLIFAVLTAVSAVIGVATAAAGRYRAMTAAWAGVLICGALGSLVLRPAIAPAYPTSFLTPAEPYAAPSVEAGARLYAQNCALCHGAGGRGDGSAAAGLAVRPADLTQPHLFAHTPGDLFWWISHGKDDGAMPGFASTLSPAQRWDLVNFVRARAAGVASRAIGPEVSHGRAPPLPDFAFEIDGQQQTLRRLLQDAPVLLVLFSGPPPAERITQLAATQRRLATSGLRVVAVELDPETTKTEHHAPLVEADAGVRLALALFRATKDDGETDLLLDRGGGVRARWTASGAAGVVTDRSLAANLDRVKDIAVGSEAHAGHTM
jgi:putative copper export protein/mono/diheme cytochrome c family protein